MSTEAPLAGNMSEIRILHIDDRQDELDLRSCILKILNQVSELHLQNHL